MTWGSRFRMLFGAIAVVALVGVLTVVFNQRQHAVNSSSATIAATQFPVGSDYAGTVVSTYVKQGDHVRAGQQLVAVQSITLLHDIQQKLVTPSSLTYTVSKKGTITFTSAVTGTVASITTQVGAFIQAGTTLLTIDRAASLFVTAKYSLTPMDYARVRRGASVDILLPNSQMLQGTVSAIVVSTSNGQAQTQLTVNSSQLIEGAHDGLITPGTPVTATVHLIDNGPLGGVTDKVSALLRQIGL